MFGRCDHLRQPRDSRCRGTRSVRADPPALRDSGGGGRDPADEQGIIGLQGNARMRAAELDFLSNAQGLISVRPSLMLK